MQLRYVCTGCGNEIPEGQEFCYVCGTWSSKALKLNDEGTAIYSPRCFTCGEVLPDGAEFCPKCGKRADESQITVGMMKQARGYTFKDYLAIILAIIPGFFNIFGLGQIIQKRWSQAFVFISCTILLLYLSPSFMSSSNTTIILIVMQLGLFLFSLMDVFKALRRG